eukprot:494221-Pyramimonas_sp.AAC.1
MGVIRVPYGSYMFPVTPPCAPGPVELARRRLRVTAEAGSDVVQLVPDDELQNRPRGDRVPRHAIRAAVRLSHLRRNPGKTHNKITLRFTGPPVPITARVRSTPKRPFRRHTCKTVITYMKQ